jgi:hypothetical protein
MLYTERGRKMKLSKKQKQKYSRLIAAKLDAQGLKDQIQMVQIGERKIYIGGKDTGEKRPILQAKNPYRQIIKSLRNSTLDMVNAFLELK